MKRRGTTHRKARVKINRYNPNAPDYRAVHGHSLVALPLLGPVEALGMLGVLLASRRRRA